jgi:adenylosuccinate lyase
MTNTPEITALTAISPIDGRYRKTTEALANYFSEYALIRYRLRVEVEYFLALCRIPLPQLEDVNESAIATSLRNIYTNFTPEEAQHIKELEAITNHDVKAVEYFLKGKLDSLDMGNSKEFIHFGLTSQDINNTAVPLALKEFKTDVLLPALDDILSMLEKLVEDWKDIPMLAHTHGQPASPTRLGKEIMVFVERLASQIEVAKRIPTSAKFGGATGNFNAHTVAYPSINWKEFADRFLHDELGLFRQQYTTQIEHYDSLAALCDAMKRINTILLDLSKDLWTYISFDYFKQKIKAGEVGSSAMPHKVNPIDFENAEGNLGVANALFEHLAAKLPISRLQRDLTDSTVLRNLGVPFAHSIIAYKSLLKGFGKLILNEPALKRDLESNWAVVAEGVQTILRRENYPAPYEALKGLTRTHEAITQKSMEEFIDSLEVSSELKEELKRITPYNYTGI